MAAETENREWYYLREEEPEGPVSAKTLRSMLEEQIIGPDTLVWSAS